MKHNRYIDNVLFENGNHHCKPPRLKITNQIKNSWGQEYVVSSANELIRRDSFVAK